MLAEDVPKIIAVDDKNRRARTSLKTTQQKQVRRLEPGVGIVLLGFVLLLVLMVGLILSARQQMSVIQQRLVEIVNEQNVKTDLVYTMRFAARERSLDMQSALLIDDWVERDELMLHYNRMGAQFVRARQALLEMNLTTDEKAMLEKQGEITRDVVPLQNQIFDMAVEGDLEQAVLLLTSKAIPGQNRVFATLNELIEVQRAATAQLAGQAEAEYRRIRTNLITLGSAVLLLSIAIAGYVIITISRYGRQRREDIESLNQMAAYPEQNPSPVLEFNEQGQVTYMNPVARRLFPAVEEPASQHTLFESLNASVAQLRSSDRRMVEQETRVGDRYFQHWVTLIPELETVRVYSLDISDLKHTESELREHRDHLEEIVLQRTADMSNAIDELEAFCYSASHDLRAPLRSIDGFSLALLEDYGDRLDEEGLGLLGRVRNSAQNMSRLIDDLLRLSKVTRGGFQKTAIDLTRMAQAVAQTLRQEHPGRSVEVTIAPGMQAWGDQRLLNIALVNLLSNAWKYTQQRQAASIEVGMEEQAGVTVYFVRDNGVGFNQDYADKVFEPFQRLHGAEYEGSGIGMATVLRVVRRHQGRIWVLSEQGRGTCFYFTLTQAPSPYLI